MTIPSTNETEILRAQSEVVTAARGILSGGALGIVAGARRLAQLSHDLGVERDPDFIYFIGVDSETDHLPLGEVRRRWAADALTAPQQPER